MRRSLVVIAAGVLLIALAAPALAHVTVQPNEAVADSFSRFVVRVPNERDDASTVEVEVELPPLAFVSFEDKEGWRRQVKNGEFDEPVEAFGQEITEGVLSVRWTGGEIGPGEFAEFGFSAKMPAEETALTFRATQTYDSGEVVEWVEEGEDAEHPAAVVQTFDLGGGEEGGGQVATIDRLADEMPEGHDMDEMTTATGDEEASDPNSTVALILGAIGALLGLIALGVALTVKRNATAA